MTENGFSLAVIKQNRRIGNPMRHISKTALAPMDVTGVPTNNMHERLRKHATADEMAILDALLHAHQVCERDEKINPTSDNKQKAWHAFSAHDKEVWKLVDKYPKAEPKESRDDIDFAPIRIGNIAMIISNSVNLGLRSEVASARYAATGTIMQVRDRNAMDKKLRKHGAVLHAEHPVYRRACVLTPDHTVADYWHLIEKYEDDFAIVVEGDRDHFNRDAKFLGIVGLAQIQKANGVDNRNIEHLYIPKSEILTAPVGLDAEQMLDLMDNDPRGTKFLPIVDGDRVAGVTSHASCGYHLRFAPNVDEQRGGLAYQVALRHDETSLDDIKMWVQERLLGVGVKIDRAHGDRGTKPFRFIEKVKRIFEAEDPSLELHFGNVATGAAAARAVRAGATGIWVGIGPSPVCITRTVTNYGVPQIKAITDVRETFDKYDLKDTILGADGGTMDTPGHIVASLRAGATHAIGSTNASKTRESSPEILLFKESKLNPKAKIERTIWVSGNAAAVVQEPRRSHANETRTEKFRRAVGPRKEGDTQLTRMNPEFETMREMFLYETDGGTSGISFSGGDTIPELHEFGESIEQTITGFKEGQSRL